MEPQNTHASPIDSKTCEDNSAYRVTELNSISPEGLVSESIMAITTNMGKSIIVGRSSDSFAKSIIGLNQFNVKIKSIYYAAKADDPLADLMLLTIEKDFQKTLFEQRTALGHLEISLQKVKLEMEKEAVNYNLSYKIGENPLSIKLNYKLQYAHLVAFLISIFDQIVAHLMMLEAYGEINKSDFHRRVQIYGKAIRRIYRYGQFWKNHKICRQDVIKQSDRYLEARNYFLKTFNLKLTDDILYKDRMPQWGPNR